MDMNTSLNTPPRFVNMANTLSIVCGVRLVLCSRRKNSPPLWSKFYRYVRVMCEMVGPHYG